MLLSKVSGWGVQIPPAPPNKLTVTCHQVGSEASFIVYMDLSFVEPQEVAILFDAFKKSSTVKIQGNFKVRGGVIEQANLSSVTE